MAGEPNLCHDYGSTVATLARELDVSLAADLLYEIVPIILPYSDTRAVRELLPQLTRLNRTADLEDEAQQNQPWTRKPNRTSDRGDLEIKERPAYRSRQRYVRCRPTRACRRAVSVVAAQGAQRRGRPRSVRPEGFEAPRTGGT